MDKLPVGQLPDLASSNNDDEIMVITNSEYNQLKKEKISDLITDFTSTDENNALIKGSDDKMFVKNFGNASNITEGTLPVSVLPDIPKDKLPEIETSDLPVSGVTADTYAYPSSVTVNAQGQVTAIAEGTPSGANADTDLSNLTPTGEKHFLNKTQITNCLLEVPQRINVELNNSMLTLKAGSVVIVPYGTSAPTMEIGDTLNGGEIVDISWDGEKLFYYVKYDSDKVYSYTPSSSYDDVCFIASGGYALSRGISSWFSGSSAPDYERQYQQWYDTMNNIVKHSSDYGQSWTSYDSFPFCVASVTQSVGYINIKNIFNGFGFIGSTIWCDKGVKGLASNGRNADGSLKNIEYTFSKLTLMTANVGQRMYLYRLVGYETACRYEYLYIQDEQPDASDFNYTGTNAWFSPRDNYWRIYEDGDWNIVSLIPCAYADCGLTTAEYYRPNTFKTKQSFQALDYNDTEFIAHQAMPGSNYISLSLPASEGTLVAPADGYAVINATSTTSSSYISLNIKDSTNTIGILQDLKMVPEIGKTIATSLPVAKGEIIQVGYYGISLNFFRFVYANGSL